MDHTRHTPLSVTELNAAVLEGATIYGPDDHHVGKVAHVHGLGAISQVVVDVGGFLGLGAKPVALNVSDLNFMRDEDGNVHGVTRFTKDQLKALPEHVDR
ncbi:MULTISPECIES: PRC-barrel domain-containing protein [unclassified Devosia]|uniref:PRC-barrel domain-containing protein n=1 Tax=unclassified Devosia TaxID=196773 RepID=UPI00145E0B44|nr:MULTISPECIES: PRC-barrel domain-containing protein [unclassified Devosia]MBJ6986463.1 PRC-barrel domain-containing protein [Devosia sp. MC521]MBJ7576575.1 PRC-barrel domain-containing protein [Devosia sp. MC532]QMW64070.1 PRC-barrel domain-containing protein [Devosia sp. MC521]